MEIIQLRFPFSGLSISSPDRPLCIAIGHFDGVHRGHKHVINKALQEAKAEGLKSAVLTFDPHPKVVLGHGDHYNRCLTPLEDKAALFAELGVDYMLVMNFSMDFAGVTPERFVEEVLGELHAKHVIVGFDFRFGYRGLGDTVLLKELSEPNMQVHIVEPLFDKGEKVGSTFVRAALKEGNVEEAAKLLGRLYEVKGTVAHGDGRGSTIGFPTANVQLDSPYVLPRTGVYAITAWVGGHALPGVLNFGMKPTFNKEEIEPVMEAHLFDFNQDIYGMPVRIQFRSFIRSERKFDSIDALVKQIQSDKDQVRSLLQKIK